MKIPQQENDGERPCYTFNQMSTLGFLWYLNLEFLNPDGFALCLDYADGEDEPRGWSLHGFSKSVEIELDEEVKIPYRATIRSMFDLAKERGRMPSTLKEKVMKASDVILGKPTGISIKHEESLHMDETPSGDWAVEIRNNITGSASMRISREHMRHIRDMLNKAIKEDSDGVKSSNSHD